MQRQEPVAPDSETIGRTLLPLDVGIPRATPTLLIESSVAAMTGSTYYVATNGDDSNPGTQWQPWRTIERAVNTLRPGDTVYVREGTYVEKVMFQTSGTERHPVSGVLLTEGNKATFTTNLNGVSVGDYLYVYRSWKSNNGAYRIVQVDTKYVRVEGSPFGGETTAVKASIATPIIFRTYQDETVVIDKLNNDSPNVNFNHVDYIIMDGFRVTRSAHAGVSFIAGSHNMFRNGKVFGNDRPGFYLIDGSTYNIIENNEISENGQNGPGEGVYIGRARVYDGSDHNHIIHNYIHDARPGDEGVEIKTGISYSVIEDNLFEDNNSYWGVVTVAGPSTLIYRNRVDGGEGSARWAGLIYINSRDNYVLNNVMYGSSTLDGIYLFRHPGNKAYHNTIYDCHGGIGIDGDPGSMTGTEIKNNILSSNTDQLYGDLTGVTIEHNLFDGPSTAYGINAIIDAPRFMNAANGDFHLEAESPAIDAGVDVGIDTDFDGDPRPRGAGFDIGAYEYASVRLVAWYTDTTAYLSWTRQVDTDAAGYRIYYDSEAGGSASEGDSPIDVPNPDQLTFQLTGLTMYSLYELWIEPYDGNGDPLAESNHVLILLTDIFLYLPLVLRRDRY